MGSRQISTNVFIIWVIFLTCILLNVSIQTTSGQNGVIKVGLDKDFAPFEWGHDGEVKGFDVDLMNYMAEDLNQSVEYYPLIWDEVLESVKNGTIDVLFATDTPERREFFDFSLPILYSSWRIYVKENVFGITNIFDLANHTVAVCNLYASHEYIKENVPDAHLILINNVEECIEMLYNGEIFAFFTDYHQANYYILQMGYTGLKVIGDPIIMGPFCLGVKKGNHELLSQLNVSLTNVKNSEKYDLVYEKWFGTVIERDFLYPEIPEWLFPIILALICGAGFLLLWNFLLNKSVHKKTQELTNAKDLLEERVAERTEDLQHANTRLKELDSLKSMFLASMSHELRTPLNSIIGFTGWILMGMEGNLNEEQKKQLTMVKFSANHLLDLINDILDISKIEANKVELAIEKFEISEVINDIVNSVLPLANDKGLKLLYIVPKGIIINSAKRRIKQILMNLLSNAIKFTDQGNVKIEVKTLNNKNLEVIVSDSGMGIKKEEIEKLFQPFQQIDMSITKEHEGTGLGLYLCKKLLDLLHGKISVISQFGKGSEFKFIIPIEFKEEA